MGMMLLTQGAGQFKAHKSAHTMPKESIRFILQVGMKRIDQCFNQRWHTGESRFSQTILSPGELHSTYLYFAGQSMGAFVSFELARSLRKQHHAHAGPLQLFLSAQRAPQLPDPEPPTHALPDNEFIEELRTLTGTPTELLQNAEVLEIILPVLRPAFALS